MGWRENNRGQTTDSYFLTLRCNRFRESRGQSTVFVNIRNNCVLTPNTLFVTVSRAKGVRVNGVLPVYLGVR